MTPSPKELLAGLRSSSREEIWESAKQLEQITLETTLELIRLLDNGQSPDTRGAAAYVLGFTKCGAARVHLEQLVADAAEDAPVRGHAAEALGYIGDPRSIETLIHYMEVGVSSLTYWCAFALGQIGDPRAIPALEKVAESSGEQAYEGHSLRGEALDAISQIRS